MFIPRRRQISCLTFYSGTDFPPVFQRQLKTILECWKNGVTDDSFTTPIRDHEAQLLGDRLEALWNKENISRKKPSFIRLLAQFLGIKYVLFGLLFSIADT